jgi:hypothetical protein
MLSSVNPSLAARENAQELNSINMSQAAYGTIL